jgi:hypothetical protein
MDTQAFKNPVLEAYMNTPLSVTPRKDDATKPQVWSSCMRSEQDRAWSKVKRNRFLGGDCTRGGQGPHHLGTLLGQGRFRVQRCLEVEAAGRIVRKCAGRAAHFGRSGCCWVQPSRQRRLIWWCCLFGVCTLHDQTHDTSAEVMSNSTHRARPFTSMLLYLRTASLNP